MSISLPLSVVTPPTLAWMLLALASGMVIVLTVVALRRGSVAGPARIAPAPGELGQLAGVTAVGLVAWILIPGMFAAALRDPASPASPGTAPTTAPAPTVTPPAPNLFTPRQTVIVSIAGGVGAGAALVIANLMFRPGGLGALGFSIRSLPRGLMLGILAATLVLPLTFLAAALTDWLWRVVDLQHPGAHEMLQILGEAPTPTFRVLIYVSAILVAPLFEELLFRGHIQTLLVGMFGSMSPGTPSHSAPAGIRWIAILVTSLLFALVHAQLWMMPPIFFLSLCLGYVYERTGNLWSAVAVHLMFNLSNVVLFMTVGHR